VSLRREASDTSEDTLQAEIKVVANAATTVCHAPQLELGLAIWVHEARYR